MYCVKEKHFVDSVQYQIYEKEVRFLVEEERKEDALSYLLDKPKKKKHIYEIKFDDGTVEHLTKWDDEAEAKEAESLRTSRSRTIKNIYDIGRSNVWEWFITFTLNKEKVDRFNYEACVKKVSQWLKNLKKRNPDMIYLLVPEQHKNGAWHFHGLFSNMNEDNFVKSGICTEDGKDIFNVGTYKLGFTEAIRLDGSFAIVGYITKYITKNLCEATKGKKRYWASKNVKKPVVEQYELEYKHLEDIIEQLDLNDARIVTKNGYKTVTYIDKQSIPQTHVFRIDWYRIPIYVFPT